MKSSAYIPEQRMTVSHNVVDMASYIASLDMAIALCEQRITHTSAAYHLRKLRAEMMEVYSLQVS